MLGRKPACVISPVIEIVPIGDTPDLDAFEMLIITSGHAVRLIGEAISGRRVVTVGEGTAKLACSAGAHAICLGDNVEEFLSRIGEVVGPALHLRGVHARGDIAGKARMHKISVDECIIYDQVEKPLNDRARDVLRSGIGVVPVFSPRSAKLLSQYPCHPDSHFIAMSAAVANEFDAARRVEIAKSPDGSAMCDMVVAAF